MVVSGYYRFRLCVCFSYTTGVCKFFSKPHKTETQIMLVSSLQHPLCNNHNFLISSPLFQNYQTAPHRISRKFNLWGEKKLFNRRRKMGGIVCGYLFPVDPWAPSIDSASIAPQLFALSLFPYLGFLYFITKSKSAPKLTLFGFYFLLAFVGATIPAGIYAKVHYGTSLSNVDWLHGGAESLLTLTNLFIVLGLRGAIREAKNAKESSSNASSVIKEEKNSPI